jgi:hypothetical protein
MVQNTLQYVTVDYAAHRDSLLQRIRSRWSLSWNDFLANNFGRIIVDLIAYSVTVLAYLINRAVAENFISTMTLRESAVRIGSLVEYQLHNAIAAAVACEAMTSSEVTESTLLAKGTVITVVSPSGSLPFELAEDYTIEPGTNSPSQLILTIDPFLSGDQTLNSKFVVTVGSENIDLIDSAVDLSTLVSTGQYLTAIGADFTHAHRIVDVIAAPGAAALNRLVVSPAWGETGWSETSGTISATITERRVSFVQGQTFSESITTPATEVSNYVIRLSKADVIENSVSVTVNNTAWDVLKSLSNSDSEATAVITRLLSSGETSIVFGDGVFGALAPTSANVTVTYRTGGGAVGNIGVGLVNSTVIGQQSAAQVVINITNTWSPGEGGADAESLSEARSNIPAFIQANRRGVTAGDYSALAIQFNDPTYGQVKFARTTVSGTNSLLEGNVVSIYAWTTGPSGGLIPLTPGLKGALSAYLKGVAIGTDYPVVQDGTTRPAPISARVRVRSGSSIVSVENAVNERILDIVKANKPGDPINFSDLISELSNVTGVAALNLATPLTDLNTTNANEIFTVPDDTFSYDIELKLLDGYTYVGQLPVTPLTAWCFNVGIDGNQALVIPDTKAGRARLIGDSTDGGLATYDVGLLANRPAVLTADLRGNFYYATDVEVLYRVDRLSDSSLTNPTLFWNEVDEGGSYVDLNSGRLVVSFKSDARTVTFNLTTVNGYDVERTVNLFVYYSGDNSLNKRREIRAAIRSWASGLKIGDALFSSAIRGTSGNIILSASRSNVTDVVLSVPGVLKVNQVQLDSQSNSALRLDAASTELLKIGSISVNNFLD